MMTAKETDIGAVRQSILDAANDIVQSVDLTPANRIFHDARYSLYSIAASEPSSDVLQGILQDPDVRDAARKIFPIACRAGILEECTTARALLARDTLDFDDIYAAYYGDVYQTLMNDELAFLDTLPAPDTARPLSAFYVGGGAMPVPAMLMVLRLGYDVTVIDPHAESCDLARALAKRLGIADKLRVIQQPGERADYTGCDYVWIANWLQNKEAIFARIHQYANVSHVIARSAPDNSFSFVINDRIDEKALCAQGYAVAFRSEKRANLSLVSVIFRNLAQGAALPRQSRKIESMTEVIGNTPILHLDPAKTGLRNIDVYAKLEHLNPFGSVKDRTALAMLAPHMDDITANGKKVLELSSGNAARALQAIASMHGTVLETVSSRIRLAETRKLLQLQGAIITPLDPAEVDPTDAYSALHIVDRKARDEADRYFYTDQYRNGANVDTHSDTTGREITEDLGAVDYFFGAIGTAGSSVGIARSLKAANAQLDISGVVSGAEDFIPGIRHYGEIFNVGPFEESFYSRILPCTAQESIDGVLDLIRHYGVMGGPSSGAAYHAAMAYLRSVDAQLTSRKKAVFIVCDRVEPYLSYIEERRPSLFE